MFDTLYIPRPRDVGWIEWPGHSESVVRQPPSRFQQ